MMGVSRQQFGMGLLSRATRGHQSSFCSRDSQYVLADPAYGVQKVNVRCYAAAGYPERPTAFEWQGRWLAVAEILRQTRSPDGMTFVVRAEDDRRYRLFWQATADEWHISSTEQ